MSLSRKSCKYVQFGVALSFLHIRDMLIELMCAFIFVVITRFALTSAASHEDETFPFLSIYQSRSSFFDNLTQPFLAISCSSLSHSIVLIELLINKLKARIMYEKC